MGSVPRPANLEASVSSQQVVADSFKIDCKGARSLENHMQLILVLEPVCQDPGIAGWAAFWIAHTSLDAVAGGAAVSVSRNTSSHPMQPWLGEPDEFGMHSIPRKDKGFGQRQRAKPPSCAAQIRTTREARFEAR